MFFVEDAGEAREYCSFFSCDLGDCAAGSEVAAQDLDVAGLLDGVGEGADENLVLGERGKGGDVFGEGFSGDGRDGAVEETGCY